ncbi:HNH endonuclease [Pantoea rwandensis]|uniref:HNH endonuclease n=1 Tax=Pantoea rwandensis TaxID=1076550 RepID=A0ABM5RHH2_9GAMM|nr:HNH endonuclease [Pantoea rwandensis]AIR85402.1 HNH endonuclease [Pantoea rwandensis]
MDSYLDILPKGSTAVAVKTKGHNFFIDNEGISSTGCWVVSNYRVDDYVIVFHQTSTDNYVYIGEFVGKNAEEYTERQGKRYPRYRIFIKNLKLALKTNTTWTSFVGKNNGGFERIYLENEGQKKPKYLDPDSIEAEEGYKKDFNRMTSIRDRKLADARKKNDNYTCQSCNNQYFVNNKYIIDCHHLNPINLGKRKTKIEDLISLCPTCHRIAHTRVPPYSLRELREIMEKHA